MYRVLSAGLIASFVGFFAHSLFDATYYDYKILLLFWILVGMSAVLPDLLAGEIKVHQLTLWTDTEPDTSLANP